MTSTASQIARNGFAVIPNVLSAHEIEPVASALAETKPKRAGKRHILRNPVISDLAHDLRLLNIARDVLGADAFPFQATLFSKTSEANWLVVWHQDTALPIRERRDEQGWGPWSLKEGVTYAHAPAGALSKVLALRIHLDDSTTLNGPLRVFPTTHTFGVLSDDEISRIAERETATDCVISKGGIVAMRPLLLHASSKSRSHSPRRVIHIEYASTRFLDQQLELAMA